MAYGGELAIVYYADKVVRILLAYPGTVIGRLIYFQNLTHNIAMLMIPNHKISKIL